MKPQHLPLVVLSLAAVLVACTPASGSLGTLAPSSPSAEPSIAPGVSDGPDATPGGGSPGPTTAPAQTSVVTPSRAPNTGPSAVPGTPLPSRRPSVAPATLAPTGTTLVRAYFHLGGDVGEAGLVPVLREVPKTQAVARAAMEALLAGPQGRELFDGAGISTAIEDGTELLGITIDGGIATVDLSGEFAAGGGSSQSFMRLAQVTYTLTQFPTVQRVAFRVDGRPVTVFGSAGIVLDGPVGRDDYTDQLPAIFVDRPAWGASLENPARVSGVANVFEAQFQVAILDTDGLPIVDEPVMASCGTGCWGTFDVTLGYDVPEPQWGTLRVYSLSARDGSPEMIRDYPVWLTRNG